MIVQDDPWLGQHGLIFLGSAEGQPPRRRSYARLRPWLLLAAAGSVALLLWQIQRRAGRRSAPADATPPVTERSGPGSPLAGAGSAPTSAAPAPTGPANVAPLWRVPAYAPDPSRAWVHRAEQALERSGPAGLRRVAEEMSRSGLEAEAGLLDNYALLLERSSASHTRVLREVGRMLQAAADDRQGTPKVAPRPVIPMPAAVVDGRRRAAG